MRKNALLPVLLFFPVPVAFNALALTALACHIIAGSVPVNRAAFYFILAASCCVSGASAVAVGVSVFKNTRRFGDLLKGVGIAAAAVLAAVFLVLSVFH
jgi:hypothetical protein